VKFVEKYFIDIRYTLHSKNHMKVNYITAAVPNSEVRANKLNKVKICSFEKRHI
jgi:hypothetical protein